MAIYYLDVDDEITSAAARIRDSSDSRIALVVQGGSRVATSRINFSLLAREARHRNRRLAIIAADASVRSLAQTADLPVFASVADYQKAEGARPAAAQAGAVDSTSAVLDELAATVGNTGAGSGSNATGVASGHGRGGRTSLDRTGRQTAWLGTGLGGLLVAALIAVVVVGGLAAYVLLPSATIVLTLREDPVGPLNLTVKVDPTVKGANDATATVPGVSKALTVQASGVFNATGQNVVETAATGTVTFLSEDTGRNWVIPAGTQVSTAGGVAFLTTARVVVPAAVFSPPTRGTVNAQVTAVKKGLSGNVGAGTIVQMPDFSGKGLLSVTNASATSGGTHTVTLFVQQSDIDAAEASLTSQLDSLLLARASDPNSVVAGQEIFPSTAHMGKPAYDPDPATLLNQAVESFGLAASGTGTATVADLSNVRSLAQRRIEGTVKAGHTLVAGSVQVVLGSPTSLGSVVSIPVTASALEAGAVDVGKLRDALKGKSVADAKAYLSQYGAAQISLSPFWTSTVPGFDFRIDLTVISPSAEPTSVPSAAPAGTERPASSPGTSPQPSQSPPESSASASGSPSAMPETPSPPTAAPSETPATEASATTPP